MGVGGVLDERDAGVVAQRLQLEHARGRRTRRCARRRRPRCRGPMQRGDGCGSIASVAGSQSAKRGVAPAAMHRRGGGVERVGGHDHLAPRHADARAARSPARSCRRPPPRRGGRRGGRRTRSSRRAPIGPEREADRCAATRRSSAGSRPGRHPGTRSLQPVRGARTGWPPLALLRVSARWVARAAGCVEQETRRRRAETRGFYPSRAPFAAKLLTSPPSSPPPLHSGARPNSGSTHLGLRSQPSCSRHLRARHRRSTAALAQAHRTAADLGGRRRGRS